MTDPTRPHPPRDLGELEASLRATSRVVHRIGAATARDTSGPHQARPLVEQRRLLWTQTLDPATRQIARALEALGFETRGIIENRAYVQTRGRRPALIVLVVAWDDPLRITHVQCGRTTMGAAQAAAWLNGGRW
jgi:hypothetical protein